MYMSATFVKRFIENENVTSIVYKKYSKADVDEYPTFSICFKGARLHWYHKQEIYDAFGLDYVQYDRMLKGESAFRYEYDSVSKLFRKKSTLMNSSDTNTNGFHLSASDFFLHINLHMQTFMDQHVFM